MLEPIIDDHSHEIDAHFSIRKSGSDFDIILESRGGSTGGRPPRNTQYAEGLKFLIFRSAENNFIINEIQIFSREAMDFSEQERLIQLPSYQFPLNPREIQNFELFRKEIGRESGRFGRQDGAPIGNRTKRLLLRIRPVSGDWTEASLTSTLSGALNKPQEPTADPIELKNRVEIELKSLTRKPSAFPPPEGSIDVKSVDAYTQRFVRDPRVIAWVLNEANGICEVCDKSAPFIDQNNRPFLEVHHVVPLAEGGVDTVSNAIGCCPNCHRELHHGVNRHGVRNDLYEKISRLRKTP